MRTSHRLTPFVLVALAGAASVAAQDTHVLFHSAKLDGRDLVYWMSKDLLLGLCDETQVPIESDILEGARVSLLARKPKEVGCKRVPDPQHLAWPAGSSIAGIMVTQPAAFIGTIEKVREGYTYFFQRVETLVFVRVEGVFRDQQGWLAPGKVVTYLDSSGRIELAHGTLCTEKPKGVYVPKAGDRIAVGGIFERPQDPTYLHVLTSYSSVFPVRPSAEGDVILPNPVPGLDQSEVTVQAVRERLAREGGQ
jgi:hypothetical protein